MAGQEPCHYSSVIPEGVGELKHEQARMAGRQLHCSWTVLQKPLPLLQPLPHPPVLPTHSLSVFCLFCLPLTPLALHNFSALLKQLTSPYAASLAPPNQLILRIRTISQMRKLILPGCLFCVALT